MIHSEEILTMISRALNLMDGRLVDHGLRVALVLGDMLEAEGCRDAGLIQNLKILAFLHDVGAYRTEEIDNMVKFETGSVWEHSIYGYLFLREFTPLRDWAKVILYHHAGCAGAPEEPAQLLRYAQMLHTADRAVIWHDEVRGSRQELEEHLIEQRGTVFSPESVELFLRAARQLDTFAKLDAPVRLGAVIDCRAMEAREAEAYLTMVVHTIDFRSRVTLTHSMSVMELSVCLAEEMGLAPAAIEQLRYGALLHDLGKIATPLSILEKPGALTGEERRVMQEHVVWSGRIIDGCVDEPVAHIALRHHEKLDGSGYPLGLSGDELTLPERIVAVADITSALCMARSYKSAFPKERCLKLLREMKLRGQLDGRVIETLEAFFDEILERTGRACAPLASTYARMEREYRSLLGQHEGRR